MMLLWIYSVESQIKSIGFVEDEEEELFIQGDFEAIYGKYEAKTHSMNEYNE